MGELVWLQIDHGQPVGEGAETSTDWYQSFGGSRRRVGTLVSSAGSSQEIQRLGERPCGFRIWIPALPLFSAWGQLFHLLDLPQPLSPKIGAPVLQ